MASMLQNETGKDTCKHAQVVVFDEQCLVTLIAEFHWFGKEQFLP
jgi:hypothetical protein